MTRAFRFLMNNNTAESEAAPPSQPGETESDFIVILASFLCALICFAGFIVVSRCSWLRQDTGNSPAQAMANKGLKKKVLQSLPKFTYTDSNPSKWLETPECAICLSEFDAGDEIRLLPQCGHGFHVRCIDTWLKSHSSCPSCRQVLAASRCQKCGRFPAVGGDGGSTTNGAVVDETEMKSREDNNGSVSNNNNKNSEINCSNMVGHHSYNDSNNFLP